MPLRREEAIRRARNLGARVEVRGRSGELVFNHPLVGTVRTSRNNRDASKRITRFLERLDDALFRQRLRAALIEMVDDERRLH